MEMKRKQMQARKRMPQVLVSIGTVMLLMSGLLAARRPSGVSAADFADAAFKNVWARTDRAVAGHLATRSWYWGPAPGTVKQEPYAEGANGTRMVQYFDKSRMEINNPNGDKNSPFYVTNGLLTVELMSGKIQVGNNKYEDSYPAAIPMAGDPGDTRSPTYAAFAGVSNTPLGDHEASDLSCRSASRIGPSLPLAVRSRTC